MDRSERDALSTRGLFAAPLHFVTLSLCRFVALWLCRFVALSLGQLSGTTPARSATDTNPKHGAGELLQRTRGFTERFVGGRAFGDNPFSPSATIPFSDNPHARQDGGVGSSGTTGNSPWSVRGEGAGNALEGKQSEPFVQWEIFELG
jgi:hypothetical protein